MKKKIGRTSWIPTILFLIYGLIVFILLYVTIVSSFKSKTEITTNMFGLPQQWRIENYVRVIKDEHFLTYMLNSLILLVGSVIGLLIVSSLLAYGQSRYQFKGKAFLETFILFGMMFPIQLGVLVNYQVINAMGLISTLFGLMLVYIGNMSLACFLFMKFFKQLPGELSESAKIDGANEFQIFYKIMMPLCKPVIGTVTLVCGLQIFNDFYMPLIFLYGDSRTAPVIIQTYVQNFLLFIDVLFPMVVINIVPILILFIIAQKQLVEGLTAGAVKS